MKIVVFIVARPRLKEFIRHQLSRFPGLAERLRMTVARSRRAAWQDLPTPAADEAELTDVARQVLHDLRRAIDHSRQP